MSVNQKPIILYPKGIKDANKLDEALEAVEKEIKSK